MSTNATSIVDKFSAANNIELLTRAIISRNSVGIEINESLVRERVTSHVRAWVTLGRFKTIQSGKALRDYNQEFITEFADVIIPNDFIKVTTPFTPNAAWSGTIDVVRQTPPNYMKPLTAQKNEVPFWRRSVFKRLHDPKMDAPLDESEGLFYKMDSERERLQFGRSQKKIPERVQTESSRERVTMRYKL